VQYAPKRSTICSKMQGKCCKMQQKSTKTIILSAIYRHFNQLE
jgi:hypothetical protein